MAAYAALVSLNNIIDHLRLHPRPPVSLHKEQVHLLTQKLTFLQEFLQLYNPDLDYSKEADPLEGRIARAAYAAEDAIELHILDQYTKTNGEKMSFNGLYEALEKVIQDMSLIEKEAMDIKETVGFRNQLQAKSAPQDSPSRSSPSSNARKSVMVGADDLLLEMKTKLLAHARDLQTIPIVGMGGSGKTTLAFNIYRDGIIKEYFDLCAWVTIAQECSIRRILVQLLTQLIKDYNDDGSDEGELGEMLHKHLYGRRYLIILDDVWSIKVWDGVKRFLPNNSNGSRIVITTRLASALSNSNSLVMKLLDEDASWDLLSKTVFGEEGCPPGFEEIGKKIGKSCKGLPLSIVVVGGLLAKSKQTREFWEHIHENLNAVVNLEDGERCLKILYMSYKQLPVHLKPCFLYMGIYSEDYVIHISNLIRFWIAEGFLKPVPGKMLEDVARVYIKDLSDRNLILIRKVGSIGSIKECKVHDLLRDLCLREAQKEGLYTVCPGREIENKVSRIVMSGRVSEIKEIYALPSVPLARSLILDPYMDDDVPPHVYPLLRIYNAYISSDEFLDNVHVLVNSRSCSLNAGGTEIPSLVWRFWNLQTLVVSGVSDKMIVAPTDIWYMYHVRHLYYSDVYLPDPTNVRDGIVLENLHTLGRIRDFTCSEQVIKRIPNIRKLDICYGEGVDERFCLTNLDCLDKLETLICFFDRSMCQMNYPQSLKKLDLGVETSQCWQEILDKIGVLPHLEKLKLYDGTFKGQWETSDDQFRSLKYLSLEFCVGLNVWTSEASHFPRLEQLRLQELSDLEEIPSEFADISTLRLIDVDVCSDSVVESAKRILEEQEELYAEETTLRIQVKLWGLNNPALKNLSSPNFHVTLLDEE